MGYVLNGKYHEGTPPDFAAMVPQKTSVWKQSDHDRQRRDNKRDLVQPYLRNGQPNPEFIEAFPQESQETYKFIPTDEEISKEASKNG